jgi:hypothetical protein
VFSLGAPGVLAALLASAGLEVEHDERAALVHRYADVADYWTWASTVVGFPVDTPSGPATRALADYPSDVRAAVRGEVLARLAPYEQSDGSLPLPGEGVLVSARR